MGKHKQPKRKSNKKKKPPSPKKEPSSARTRKTILEILGALVTIAAFVLTALPKLSVDASESVASFSPMGTIFYLSNEGMLPIYDVAVSAANLGIDGPVCVIGPWEFTNVPKEAKADVLPAGHKMSLPYAAAFGLTAVNNFEGAQLTMIVRYKPCGVWWRRTERFSFIAVRTASGSWVWKSVPHENPPMLPKSN